MTYIPAQYLAHCHYCDREVDVRKPGVHQWLEGWAMNRQQGGTNSVSFPTRYNRYACKDCMDLKRLGVSPQQGTLL